MSFLLGEHMTGGYGATDILHDCSIGVEKVKSQSSSAQMGPESQPP